MSASLTILFVGPLYVGSTTEQRMRAFAALGHTILPVDIVPGELAARRLTLGWRVQRRLFGDRDESQANERLLAMLDAPAPDMVWIEKGLTIEPGTLAAMRARWPHTRLVAFSPDDMFNPRNQSRQWRDGIGLYDLHVTTKTFNVSELRAAGARDVFYFDKGFSPEVHRPWPVTPERRAKFGGDVGFVGWPEAAREKSMRALARHGIPVRIWGPWPKWKRSSNLLVEGRPLWDQEYAMALSSFRINLGFLRRVNRDRHTTRSIEIPACGGFLLAERTDEHLALFREGVEAEFFGDDAELVAKAEYYLAHEEERARIAAAGLARCHEGGYDNHHRLSALLRYALASRVAAAA
ncbi:MAG: glycosyltransferase [Candidatus Eisenbacteria bacterium]